MAYTPTAPDITNTTITLDQEKYLELKLLHETFLLLGCGDICTEFTQPEGTGKTANFIRYVRMNTPLSPLSEGISPTNSSFAPETVTVTADQWGDVVILSDVAEYTARHPLMQTAVRMLADNAARVMDREIQLVWLAGTNVQYGTGAVTSRPALTSSMVTDAQVVNKARVNLVAGGARPRGMSIGDQDFAQGTESSRSITKRKHFVAIASPQVMADIMDAANAGAGEWVDVAQYNDAAKLYNAEVGTWRGFVWVESNFLPIFQLLGNNTAAAAEGADAGGITGLTLDVQNHASGTLAALTTFWWKVTRKDKKRGFEELISIRHSTATGAADDAFVFTMPSTAGYVYNVYFGASDSDAALFRVSGGENVEPSGVVTVLAVPASGTTPPPAVIAAAGTAINVHPIYIHGAESCGWVGMQKMKMYISPKGHTKDDPIDQRRPVGYKFMGKTVILNQNFMLRVEVASAY